MTTHKHKPEEELPLPDPEKVQERVAQAVARLRERKAFYGFFAVLVVAAVAVILVLRSAPARPSTDPAFLALWERCRPIRDHLNRDESSRKEIETLEAEIPGLTGKKQEGYALWLAATYRYAEAWTPEKLSAEEQRPHLEKALAHLKSLKEERFDGLLLTKSNWFSPDPVSPVDALAKQIAGDLEWLKGNSSSQPQPAEDPVAVLRTSLGDIHLRFFSDLAPEHVRNFIMLSKAGTYNGTTFHYIVGGKEDPSAIACGDPYTFFYPDPHNKKHVLRWDKGTLGYDLPPEEARVKVSHLRGIVTSQRTGFSSFGMASSDADWDNAVSFLLLTRTVRAMDRIHTPFAQVVEGLSLLDQITQKKTAGDDPNLKNEREFQEVQNRDLIVDRVLIHKVIIFSKGVAEEGHAFELQEGEKQLATLKNTPAAPLPDDQAYCGRLLREISAAGEVRRGLDIPFPADVDVEQLKKDGKSPEKGERG